MSEFAAVLIWLALGGFGFRVFGRDMASDGLPGLFFACLLLAPFAAGAAIAEKLFRPGENLSKS